MMKTPYTFNANDLDLYEWRLPPMDVYMARQRIKGATVHSLAKMCNTGPQAITYRMKTLYHKIRIMKEIDGDGTPFTETVIEGSVKHFFQEQDWRAVIMFVRGYSFRDIAEKIYKFTRSHYHVVSKRMRSIFDELEQVKDWRGLTKTSPHQVAAFLRKTYARRVKLARNDEMHTLKITPTGESEPKAISAPVFA